MVRSVATKWIIGLVIYFVILFSFMSMIGTFANEYNLEEGGIISSSGGGDIAPEINETCMNPREYVNPITGEQYLLNANDKRCEHLIFINSTSCDAIEGCSWSPSGVAPWYLAFLGFPDYDASCEGDVDIDYYGYNGSTFSRFDICELPDLTEDICYDLGCTWSTDNAFDEIGYKNGFFVVAKVVGDIITFRLNFSTGSSGINALLTLILIWIPLMIMILSGYIMLR